MAEQVIQVVFVDHHVTITTSVTDIMRRMKWIFSALLTPSELTTNLGMLSVCRTSEGYQLNGDVGVELEDGSLPDVMRCLQYSVIQLFIQARPDLIWLHAGAVARNGTVLLVPGKRGQGKSGISTGLCQHGWHYLSDDISPLDPETNRIVPFAQSPTVRAFPGEQKPDDWLRAYNKQDMKIAIPQLVRDPLPLASIVFPQFVIDKPSQIEQISPAITVLELLQNCWNYEDHKDKLFEYLSGLVQRVPAFRLIYGNRDKAVQTLLESLL